jgi:hypothetical protein
MAALWRGYNGFTWKGRPQRRRIRTTIDSRKSKNQLDSAHEQFCAFVSPLPLRTKGHEKFIFVKIPRNPLKSLVSDERIQGNPSFSNPHNQVFWR